MIMKLLKILNFINLLSLLAFLPARFGYVLLQAESGTLTENICVNQIVFAITISVIIGIIGRVKKVARPETGLAIITESEKIMKILAPVFLIICFVAFAVMKLSAAYLLVCAMHAMGIFNSSRIINTL